MQSGLPGVLAGIQINTVPPKNNVAQIACECKSKLPSRSGFGDELLLYGRRKRFLSKAPLALLIMAAVLTPVVLDRLPIAIAAVAGVILMVLARCLTMEEVYRAIEWNAVFSTAGMLPLGIAMEQTGAARYLAEGMVGLVGGLGPLAVMTGLLILAALASQVMPNPAVAVLLALIAISTASDLGISPEMKVKISGHKEKALGTCPELYNLRERRDSNPRSLA